MSEGNDSTFSFKIDKKSIKLLLGLVLLPGGGYSVKTLIWEPYNEINQARIKSDSLRTDRILEEQHHSRSELQQIKHGIIVIQHQLSGMALDNAIEATNEELNE
jgi:hypothetical protein